MKLIKLTNETFEEEMALYNLDTKQLIVKGECYHNKINDDYIDGFIFGLQYAGVEIEITEKYISRYDELFDICGFYNGNDEDKD